jgi:MoxR-like ATPase
VPEHTVVELPRDLTEVLAEWVLGLADRAATEAITATEAVKLVATAQALAEWVRAAKAGEDHERRAAVFVLRAKRIAGQRLAEAQARGEIATQGRPPNLRTS